MHAYAVKRTGRNKKWYAILSLLTIGFGLGSRKFAAHLPAFVADYAGDALWALLVFWLFGLLLFRQPSHRVAVCALLFAFAIEFSQLYQAPWINQLRKTTLGSLVLGHGFLWSDLLCYTAGIAIGYWLEIQYLYLKQQS